MNLNTQLSNQFLTQHERGNLPLSGLSPVASYCLTPLITLVVINNISRAGSVTAIAITGLSFVILVVVGVYKGKQWLTINNQNKKMIETTFIKEFIDSAESQKQIEQIQQELNRLVEFKGANLEALEELKITHEQINQILNQFNNQKEEDSLTLSTKSNQLQQVSLLLNNLANQYQETFSERLFIQLKYYAKSFISLSKKFKMISFVKQTTNRSDYDYIEMLRLLSEYLNISWEVFPEEVMMYGALAKGITKEKSESNLFLNNAVNSYIQIAGEAAQKAFEFHCQQIASQNIENIFDNLIQKSDNQLEVNLLQKAKQEIKFYPAPIKEGLKNIITFEASTLEDEELDFETQFNIGNVESENLPQQQIQLTDNRTPEEIEEQIKKNQKLAEHFRRKLTEKDERTPEEMQQDIEDFNFLQEVIKKYR